MLKQEWPTDVIIVVCEICGNANYSQMLAPTVRHCRDCKRSVDVDMATIIHVARKYLREAEFMCVECSSKYDWNTIDEIKDCRI
jgi:hypothetical protein